MQAVIDKELVLHIGLEKTGTTALQRFLHDNSRVLLDNRVCYPNAGRQNGINHHALLSHVSRRRIGRQHAYSAPGWDNQLSELLEEVRHLDVSKVVLSSEILAHDVDFDQLRNLTSSFAKTSVLVYLRPQGSYLASLYSQFVKSTGEFRTFDLENLPEADYYKLCLAWAEFIGSEGGLYVRRYGPTYEHQGQILQDFMGTALGLTVTEGYRIHAQNPNPRLSRDCHEFKKLINLCFPRKLQDFFIWPLERYSLMSDAENASLFSATNLLTPAGLKAIEDIYKNSNQLTAEQFLQIEDGVLFDTDKSALETGIEYDGLSRESTLEILSWLIDYFGSERPEAKSVPGHTQRCIFLGLARITRDLINEIEPMNSSHPFVGNSIAFSNDVLATALQIKADVSALHAGH